MASPCVDQVERAMKRSKAREWTVWELAERVDYSYSSIHLALKKLVENGNVKRRLLEADGRLGRPGYGYWINNKKVAR